MRLLDNRDCNDPTLNLALEEYAVRHLDPEPKYLLFYVNSPSVIVGKNQNTLEEINHRHVEAEKIQVVRRISGGGAVYHDRGNLNFSFIVPFRGGRKITFKEFTEPVVRALHLLGVNAELTGRNDIVVGGRKISGNAQFSGVHAMFSHGTLLFDSDLGAVVKALSVSLGKIESKGLKSIRSRVANIREFLTETDAYASLDLEGFRNHLLSSIFGDGEIPRQHLTDAQWQEVEALADSKYRQWDWNYGASPDFNVQKKQRFDIGEIDLRIDVQQGKVHSIRIFGDFLGLRAIEELEHHLCDCRYHPEALEERLRGWDLSEFFGPIEPEAFLRHLY